MNYGIFAAVILLFSLLSRLELMQKELMMIGLLPFVISLTVEGWLTAPMSASSPMLFFVGGLIPSLFHLTRNQSIGIHEA